MTETVRLSFEGPSEDPSPLVVVYNPEVLSGACRSQVRRFGLAGGTTQKPLMSGKLQGSRVALTQVIQSYGFGVQIVAAARQRG